MGGDEGGSAGLERTGDDSADLWPHIVHRSLSNQTVTHHAPLPVQIGYPEVFLRQPPQLVLEILGGLRGAFDDAVFPIVGERGPPP